MLKGTNRIISIAICQMNITIDKSLNLQKAESMIIKAHKNNNSEIVVLPEMFNCPYNHKYFSRFSETYPGETTSMLSGLAKKLNIFIVGGSIPERDGNRIFNTSFIFGRDGKMIARHRKVHLFDINIKNGISFKESRFISPGEDITVFNTDFCMTGVAICYDMRFPEFIRKMTLAGAKLIIVPAAFNTVTGPAHWHITARVRALDNQIYFVCASPARNTGGDYVAYGHSLITDPWGSIIAETCEEESILAARLDLSEVERVREELPLLKHRKPDIYKI